MTTTTASSAAPASAPPIIFCAQWATPPQRTWSGTTWALRTALAEHFAITDFSMQRPQGLAAKVAHKARRTLGADDFNCGNLRRWDAQFWREHPQLAAVPAGAAGTSSPAEPATARSAGAATSAAVPGAASPATASSPAPVVFQFDEAPLPRGPARHYIYQDLCVQWVHDCSRNAPELFPYTGFGHIPPQAIERRLAMQREYYSRAAGVFCMGRWYADYLVGECGLPAQRVHHVGGGINVEAWGGVIPAKRHAAAVRWTRLPAQGRRPGVSGVCAAEGHHA